MASALAIINGWHRLAMVSLLLLRAGYRAVGIRRQDVEHEY